MHRAGPRRSSGAAAARERRGREVDLQLPDGCRHPARRGGKGGQLHRLEPQGRKILAGAQRHRGQGEDQGEGGAGHPDAEGQAHADELGPGPLVLKRPAPDEVRRGSGGRGRAEAGVGGQLRGNRWAEDRGPP